ncbi:hypothetical protein JCM8202v2_006198 [Rhodotorula sphaerocarpa]
MVGLPRVSSPREIDPPVAERMPHLSRGSTAALGPKAGARLLASQLGQRAMRKADELECFSDADERDGARDIRDLVPVRTDGGLSTVTGSPTSHSTGGLQAPAHGDGRADPSSTPSSKSASQHSIPRVPVLRIDLDPQIHSPKPLLPAGRRMSIHDLTRQASEEEKRESLDETDKRKESLSRASGAGLGSPFSAAAAAAAARQGDEEKRVTSPLSIPPNARHPSRRPPIAGLNRAVPSPLPDKQGNGDRSTSYGSTRTRKLSGDSTSSVSKDVVLNQLSDAIKRERKKAEAYERERKQGQSELEEIGKNLEVLKEKYSTLLGQQEETIESLRAELEETEAELDWANDLDEESAERYLELLTGSAAADALRLRRHVVGAFDPSALGEGGTASPAPHGAPTATSQPSDAVRKAAALFRRGLSLKRRVDTHIAAYDTVANVSLPKPTLSREPRPTEPQVSSGPTSGPTSSNASAIGHGPPPGRRTRKMSKSRSLAVLPTQNQTSDSGLAPEAAKARKAFPPPPAPFFRSLSSQEPSPLDAKPRSAPAGTRDGLAGKSKRPPPVAGLTRGRGNGAEDSTATPEQKMPGLARKRSNSLTQGVQKTMRILFPPHAPRLSKEEERINNVRDWMQAAPPQTL